VKYLLVNSNIPGTPQLETRVWNMTPLCRRGGRCDVVVESSHGAKWKARALFSSGGYRWGRTVPGAFTCGSGSTVDYTVSGVVAYTIHVTGLALRGNVWVASRFEGFLSSKGTKGCGISGLALERQAIRGHLRS